MSPLVSVLLVTYNLQNYVERAVKSVLDQTYDNFQIILVDDYSSDGTWGRVQQFRSRVKLIRHKKRCFISAALNTALKHAVGDYIVRLDGDDKMYATLIDREVKFLEDYPELGYVHCDYHVVDETGKRMKKPKLREYDPENIYHVDMTAVGTMMRKKIFDERGWFDPEMHLQEMYEFYLRALRNYKGAFLPEKLWAYTRRPGQATSEGQRVRFLKYTLLAIEKNYLPELTRIVE